MIMMVASERAQQSFTRWGEPPHRLPRDSRIRQLALAHVRELRRRGLSYREIGRRFSSEQVASPTHEPGTVQLRLAPERLHRTPEVGLTADAAVATDRLLFLRTLDAVDQGIAFFAARGTLLHANRTLARLLESHSEGERLRAEVQHFAASLCGLVHLWELTTEPHVEELATREVPIEQAHYRLKGSYIGLDLFGQGPSLLIALEKSASDSPSDETLQEPFGCSKQESRIARFLVEGCSNHEIAGRLFISPHTARHHTERVLRKLGGVLPRGGRGQDSELRENRQNCPFSVTMSAAGCKITLTSRLDNASLLYSIPGLAPRRAPRL